MIHFNRIRSATIGTPIIIEDKNISPIFWRKRVFHTGSLGAAFPIMVSCHLFSAFCLIKSFIDFFGLLAIFLISVPKIFSMATPTSFYSCLSWSFDSAVWTEFGWGWRIVFAVQLFLIATAAQVVRIMPSILAAFITSFTWIVIGGSGRVIQSSFFISTITNAAHFTYKIPTCASITSTFNTGSSIFPSRLKCRRLSDFIIARKTHLTNILLVNDGPACDTWSFICHACMSVLLVYISSQLYHMIMEVSNG